MSRLVSFASSNICLYIYDSLQLSYCSDLSVLRFEVRTPMIMKIVLLCVSTPCILLEAIVLMKRSLLVPNQLYEDDTLWTIESNLPPPSTVTGLIFISSFV
jgi:hypothetical protein